MKSVRNWVRLAVSLFTALTIVQSFLSVAKDVSLNLSMCAWVYMLVVVLLGMVIFIANGFCLEGYLVRSASISIHAIGTSINVKRGDVFKEDGVVVIGVNDFFDTIVDDSHISEHSLHGMMINKYWSGNGKDLDDQIEKGLVGLPFDFVKRDGIAKEKRYQIGTSVFVKAPTGTRFVLVVLSKTNTGTNKTQSILRNLDTAIRGALSVAREKANGDDVSFPLMGNGNARIKAPEQALFNTLLSTIISECLENDKISNRINIVLYKDSLKELNLFALEKEWNI